MRRAFFLAALPLVFAAVAAASCGGGSSSGSSTTSSTSGLGGAGGGGGASGGSDAGDLDDFQAPPDAGPVVSCTLDNGGDPVAFCVQKTVLSAAHQAALVASVGVVSSWDSTTFAPDRDASGVILHDVRDDAAYAAAASRFHKSAEAYGDTELSPTLDADLVMLAPRIVTQLATVPASAGGGLYADLRTAAGGLRYLSQDDLAKSLDTAAEAVGSALYTAHFTALAGSPSDAGAGDGGVGDGILGTPSGAGGAVAYDSAEAAEGALALLDLAARHATDDPTAAQGYLAAATATFEHLHAHARDTASGLYFSSLVTSGDADHDALAPATGDAPADALSTDVQARVAIALLRAQGLVNDNPTALAGVASYPFEARGDEVLAALHAPSLGLHDATTGAYRAAYVASTKSTSGGFSTRAHALLFAAIHRSSVMGSNPYTAELPLLRALLTAALPAHSSLLSVVDNQLDYFDEVPVGFSFDAADAGAGHPKSYTMAALAAVTDGLTEQWLTASP